MKGGVLRSLSRKINGNPGKLSSLSWICVKKIMACMDYLCTTYHTVTQNMHVSTLNSFGFSFNGSRGISHVTAKSWCQHGLKFHLWLCQTKHRDRQISYSRERSSLHNWTSELALTATTFSYSSVVTLCYSNFIGYRNWTYIFRHHGSLVCRYNGWKVGHFG